MLNVASLRPIAVVVFSLGSVVGATPQAPEAPGTSPRAEQGVEVPSDYVIGSEDILSVVFWKEQELSADVVVRPDGKVSLPLLNDVQAAGLTPDELRVRLTDAAKRFVAEPTVSVVVKAINSRKVYITGNVQRPGAYLLSGAMTVLQLIAMSGGVLEYANSKDITVMRNESSGQKAFPFNFKDISKGKNLKQNIELRPGDTVIVP
jgi:polysaccharide export outer membrane protein